LNDFSDIHNYLLANSRINLFYMRPQPQKN